MSDSELDERELRRRVEKRMKARQEFNIHLTIYILVNLFLWFIWFFVPQAMIMFGASSTAVTISSFPWPLLVMGGWGIGLITHGLDTYAKTSAATARREARIQHEIALERQRIAELRGEIALEKPKRRARLAEDGEIVYDDEPGDEDQYEEPRRVRRARRE